MSRKREADSARWEIHVAYMHLTKPSLSEGNFFNFGMRYS